jgi:hypothetical protein
LGWSVSVTIMIYLIVAYLVMPRLDHWNARRHPDLATGEHLTQTGSGIPGDPLNIAVVGSEEDVVRALHAAGWDPANPLTFASSVRIAVDTVFKKPDPNAPVSSLYLYGRKEDLAFEKAVGHSPRERHHVRFWRSDQTDDGRPVWMGAATHDIGVELSRTTAQICRRCCACGCATGAKNTSAKVARHREAGGTGDTIIPIEHAKALAGQIRGTRFTAISGGHNDWSANDELKITR